MKKLYLFLFTVLCFAFVSKADIIYKFNFTVEDPENVTVKVCDYDDPTKVLKEFEVEKGLNNFEYELVGYTYANLFVNAAEGKILKVHKEDGSICYDVANNALKIYLSPWAYGPTEYTYTIKTFDEESFRSHSVKVTLDNPDGIRMTLRGGNVINADTTEYVIPFNEDYEDALTIRKADTEELIYKITANGEEVVKEGLEYNIPLVDRSDEDDIKYITDIVITQDFPEDLLCTIKFIFTNGDPGCVSSVTYNDIPVENFAAEEGFQVNPGKKLYVTFNREDYKMISYQKNDDAPYESSYISIVSQPISSDFTLTVTAEKYTVYEATLVIEDPATVLVTNPSTYPATELELVAGENVVTFTNAMYGDQLNVAARDGYEMARIYDSAYDNEVTISTWGPTTTIYLKENSRFEISTNKIIRDKNIAFYVDDPTVLYYGVTFSRGGSVITAKPGYNLVDYRDADGNITISASYAESSTKYYLNGQPLEVTYFGYYTYVNPQDNDVVKLFYVPENAIEHTVTFDMVEGTLDGYEVKKDILAKVDPTQPVSAVGKTQFTIAPVSREGSDLTVTIGDENVEAVDGVYTFETEGDTTVKVTKATSGIENVICGENGTADVYNLQGIRVARQAKAADVNALPAGIYVVNGQKVIVK